MITPGVILVGFLNNWREVTVWPGDSVAWAQRSFDVVCFGVVCFGVVCFLFSFWGVYCCF